MYYIDSPSFSTATAVFDDELLTIKAADGYYKFGTAYREQLGGVLLNSINCNQCIDCKQFVSFDYKTGTGPISQTTVIGYTDCWGYNKTLTFELGPTGGNAVTTIPIDGPLCVKNGSVNSISGWNIFNIVYTDSVDCDANTELIQSTICTVDGLGSETPTGCSIDCSLLEASSYVFITSTTAGYLQNGDIVYNTNNPLDPYIGGDLYYKINYDNIFYGVKISNSGVISELTYCNP